MNDSVQLLLALGCLFLASGLVDTFGRRTAIPRISLLMLLGMIVSSSGFDVLPPGLKQWFPVLTSVALVMVGFLLGEKFTLAKIRSYGNEVLWISLGGSVGTSLIVILGLTLVEVPLPLALLLGGIAAATDPAAILDVIQEMRDTGEFGEKLLGAVALDDAWGFVVFSVCASLAMITNGDSGGFELALSAVWEVGGAVLLGVLLGLPAAYFTGRLDPGQPSLVEALGIVFLCCGLSTWLGVSFLIASMVLGAVVANLADHHERPFHEIEGVEGPFLILFFVLAGASLDLVDLEATGLVLFLYIGFRWLGKVLGAGIGAKVSGASPETTRWVGLAMSPQAGVAIGMSLIAIDTVPAYRDVLLPVVIASTVFFELAGPICTRLAIRRVAE